MDAFPMLYSCCSGYNFYFADNRRPYEVFHKNKNILQHVKTEKYFYSTPFPDDLNNDAELTDWVALIRKPVDLKHYIWPVDVVALYDPSGRPRYALVFPIRALPVFESISALLANDLHAGWQRPWVKKFVENLLEAWCRFDDSRYAYHEFSLDNMFYQKETFATMFDFSFSTQKVASLYDTRPVSKKRITPDYADSYYYVDTRNSLMDLASDYYSIAVILFKLLVGRLPYQGKVMEHEPNANEQEHKNWLRIYHKNTYFIFDQRDETNHIGGETGFAKDETFVDRWNELPESVRNMFHNVFQTANVLRTADNLHFYSPHAWRDALFGAAPPRVELDDRVGGATPVAADTPPAETETLTSEKSEGAPEEAPPEAAAESGAKAAPDAAEAQAPPPRSPDRYFDVVLETVAASDKIVTIKILRDITGLGLATAKKLVDSVPSPVVQGVSEKLARQIQAELNLVSAETRLYANTKRDEQLETDVSQRMQGHWQNKAQRDDAVD
jgi:large subunit ribosomal protein L7/L12